MKNSCRTLEITILSGEDLRINQKYVKKNTYVIVRKDHLNLATTKMDTEGGSYPSWNQKLIIDMPSYEHFVTLEVWCKMAYRDKIIGSIRMPVTDFMGGYLPDNYLNLLSYRLRDDRGERNGIINVSIKVKTPEYLSNRPKKALSKSTTSALPPLTVAIDGSQENFGVVTGVPVVWGPNQVL